MKKINRFYIIFLAWAGLLSYMCVSNNPYLNYALFFIGLMACVVALAYVDENANEKEQKFMEKLNHICE